MILILRSSLLCETDPFGNGSPFKHKLSFLQLGFFQIKLPSIINFLLDRRFWWKFKYYIAIIQQRNIDVFNKSKEQKSFISNQIMWINLRKIRPSSPLPPKFFLFALSILYNLHSSKFTSSSFLQFLFWRDEKARWLKSHLQLLGNILPL